jgi:hypothetical protein
MGFIEKSNFEISSSFIHDLSLGAVFLLALDTELAGILSVGQFEVTYLVFNTFPFGHSRKRVSGSWK